MPTRLLRVEMAVHAHATEDEEKVLTAVMGLVPPELRGRVNVRREVLEGHYSNPITRIVVRVEGRDAEETVRYIGSRLSDAERTVLASTLESRYDARAGRLYLRFSKQEAYLGRLRLYEGDDVVRVTLVFRGSPRLEEVAEELRRLGMVS